MYVHILSIIAVRYTESVLYFFSVLSTLLFLLVRFVQYVIDRFSHYVEK